PITLKPCLDCFGLVHHRLPHQDAGIIARAETGRIDFRVSPPRAPQAGPRAGTQSANANESACFSSSRLAPRLLPGLRPGNGGCWIERFSILAFKEKRAGVSAGPFEFKRFDRLEFLRDARRVAVLMQFLATDAGF